MQNEVPSLALLWIWRKSAQLRRLSFGIIRDICGHLPIKCVWSAWVLHDKINFCDFKQKLKFSNSRLSESVNEGGSRWMTIDNSRIILCGGNSRKA